MAKTDKTDTLKKEFLEAYARTMGNASEACKAVDINRSTFYAWKEKDEAFAQAVADVEERNIDIAENMLYKAIHKGDLTAIIFYLKTKGKKRGFSERMELTGQDGTALIPSRMTDAEIKSELARLKKIGKK